MDDTKTRAEYHKEYCRKNRDRISQMKREYVKQNREFFREYARTYAKIRNERKNMRILQNLIISNDNKYSTNETIEVTNAIGTTNMRDKHSIYHWNKIYPDISECQVIGCKSDINVLAHVHKADPNEIKLYLIGFCRGCNIQTGQTLKIKDKNKLIEIKEVQEDIGKVIIIKGKKHQTNKRKIIISD
jgi:hypothetical protein